MAVGRPGRRFVMTGLDPGAESVELPAEIAHRVRHVMRLREGESVELLDGAGGAVEGEHALSDDGVLVKPRRSFRIEAPRGELRLGVPLLKSGNTELAVQKATELGATDFLIYAAARSVRRPAGRDEGRLLERLSQVVEEAVEQCGAYQLPKLRLCGDAEELAGQLGPRMLILSTGPDLPPLEDELLAGGGAVAVAIGPEGGFTREEIECLEQGGGIQVSLGGRVLRAETAVMAVAVLAARHLGWLAPPGGHENG